MPDLCVVHIHREVDRPWPFDEGRTFAVQDIMFAVEEKAHLRDV